MQVLHRNGEDRDKRPVSDAASGISASRDPDENIIGDDELEIRASHITAAAVAAAAVTSSVVTTAEAVAPTSFARPAAARHAAEDYVAPQPQPMPASAAEPIARQALAQGAVSQWRALLVSLLTLALIGVAVGWSAQWPWPERALKPMVHHLPALRKSRAAAPAVAVAPAQSPAEEPASLHDGIALLQQEADAKARLLAQKHAAAEERHRREDAALALREQRRRQAEAQLEAARANAQRAQAAAPEPPAVEAPAAPSLAEQVKQCSALSLFARESCLWKLCDGKWGQDGCPSYQRNYEGA